MKYARVGLPAALLLLMSWLGYTSYQKIQWKTAAEKMVQRLPRFTFYTLEGKPFTGASVPPGYTAVVIGHFDPDCDHCQYMAGQINSHPTLFTHTFFVMATSADSGLVHHFAQRYQWVGRENIRVVLDKSQSFYKSFGTAMVPFFFVYNQDGALKKKIPGEIKIEHLLD